MTEASVAHLGDADPNLIHFELHRDQWHEHTTDVALPPYWFFNSKMGNQILDGVCPAEALDRDTCALLLR